jgi:RNA polymerase sigma-70 factor, ECF subfamily
MDAATARRQIFVRLAMLAVPVGCGDDAAMMDAAQKQAPPDEVAMLLARCAQADGIAFRRLYELQSATLYGVALRITRRPALAADAVHDAMLQVWRNAARFDPARGNARAWLLSLVRYRALDSVSRIGREVLGAELPEPADSDPDPLDRLMASRDGEALHQCLQQVETDRRRLVLLAFVEGLTHTELAARVGQPLGTVKSSIRRALLALRSCLDGLA